jgi:ATP-binding protein involved in chromosome partitioning
LWFYIGAIIVTTPQDIALLDVHRGIEMFKKVNIPVFGVIQNMSVFQCPNCGHKIHIFGKNGAHRIAEEKKIDFLGDIPLDITIQETCDCGQPVVISEPNSTLSKSYKAIAEQVLKKLGYGDS